MINKISKFSLFSVSVFVFVFVFSVESFSGDRSGITSDEVRIGVLTTLSGPAAYIGRNTSYVTNTLVRSINEKGGINGRKLKILTQDHAYNLTKTVAVAKYLISRYDVFGFLNTVAGPCNEVLFPLIMEEKIPNVPLTVTSSMFQPFKRYVFHAGLVGTDQMQIMVDYIMKDLKAGNPRVALFYWEDSYGKECLKGLRKVAKSYGIEIVAAESTKRGRVEFSAQAVNMKRAKPDFILGGSGAPSLSVFLKEARKIGLSSQFFADVGNVSIKALTIAGDDGEGLLAISDKVMESEDVPGMNELKKITKKYEPDVKKIDPYYVWSWYNTVIFIEGLKRAGRNLTREGFVGALESMKGFDTGLTGPVTFGPNRRKGIDSGKIYKADIGNKRYIAITGWRSVYQ